MSIKSDIKKFWPLLMANGVYYLCTGLSEAVIGKEVYAKDLRAGFSLIVAGCIADGVTIIEHSEVILRGYADLIAKLSNKTEDEIKKKYNRA